MQCPRDQSALETITIDGLSLESCGKCGGLWFDHDELHEAEERADPELQWLEFSLWKEQEQFALTETSMVCPRCSGRLGELDYHDTGIKVQTCPECHGTWLDHGELEQIVVALRAELSDIPAAQLLATTLEEAADLVRGKGSLAAEWRDLRQVLRLLASRLGARNEGLLARLTQMMRDTPFS